jgi:hypothetical protein
VSFLKESNKVLGRKKLLFFLMTWDPIIFFYGKLFFFERTKNYNRRGKINKESKSVIFKRIKESIGEKEVFMIFG